MLRRVALAQVILLSEIEEFHHCMLHACEYNSFRHVNYLSEGHSLKLLNIPFHPTLVS